MSKLSSRPSRPTKDKSQELSPLAEVLKKLEQVDNSDLSFEAFFYCYLCILLLLQNFNIYRYNLYNYNIHLIFLSFAVLGKHIGTRIWCYMRNKHPFFWNSAARFLAAALFLICIVFNAPYCGVHLFLSHSTTTFLYLYLPLLSNFLLFHLGGSSTSTSGRVNLGHKVGRFFKKMLFRCFEVAYFVGFLPIKFIQNEHIYYDPVRCALVLLFVFLNCLVLLVCKLLYTRFAELYQLGKSLGTWQQVPAPSSKDVRKWSANDCPYSRGSLVLYEGKYFVALSEQNSAVPNHWACSILSALFQYPDRTHLWLVVGQASVIMALVFILLNSNFWGVYGALLLTNFCVYFFCVHIRRSNHSLFYV
eukprot:GILI01028224.1.p1 GENE.GILI01028224.1~~GILI01028224.1.p1  ORF type:complete len:361 (+),score=21.65 GILI01028224.1:71-1153(+)